MISTPAALRDLLVGSPWHRRAIVSLPVPETDQVVLALEVLPEEAEVAWAFAHTLVPKSERWPIVTSGFSEASLSWEEAIRANDFLNRQPFVPPTGRQNRDPETIIAAAAEFDLEAFWAEWSWYWGDPETVITAELSSTHRRYGEAPSHQELKIALNLDTITTSDLFRMERCLWDWEHAHFPSSSPERDYLQSFAPMFPTALLFLPTVTSWHALAYLNWFPTQYAPTEPYLAVGLLWHHHYGAELWAHYGTMLQCHVAHPPQTPDQAWDLACQQAQIAPCTLLLPGISLRHHAQSLLNHPAWFLHERP